jgi:FixJ family two-component response regulator
MERIPFRIMKKSYNKLLLIQIQRNKISHIGAVILDYKMPKIKGIEVRKKFLLSTPVRE